MNARRWTLLPFLLSVAAAAPTPTDINRVTEQVASTLDGVILPCPASLKNYGSADKRCIGADDGVDVVRRTLSSANLSLYGAWRSQTNTSYVYNWVKTPNGYVNVTVGPDATKRYAALLILDAPADTKASSGTAKPGTAGPVTGTDRTATPTTKPAPAVTNTPAFRRTLRLTSPRMNGEDIRALQNRLMDVSRIDRGKGGDGWYGPMTEANIIAFQSANGLPANGVVDAATWRALFAGSAKYFDAKVAEAIAKRRAGSR
ncbi:peptidoglycan-binding domain-containing protein [Deinococcus maricopensis]|uniref:Peptidoglycan-binding domain 1 protein n=1 Tax=Deinococcus maricopensis (strain DSM 21211 / LMG 22137 / NRRL B-23946 / LB-34) TaxID=709986 RepID=E8U9K9_DEIML|nr:peptidoglycan-binding domain-containing protein [Deinococcus maricopensis]ADV67748.1 Peptidoglycan-binding domain 1 protein [Deinococcus maricopensis DSM 21211]